MGLWGSSNSRGTALECWAFGWMAVCQVSLRMCQLHTAVGGGLWGVWQWGGSNTHVDLLINRRQGSTRRVRMHHAT